MKSLTKLMGHLQNIDAAVLGHYEQRDRIVHEETRGAMVCALEIRREHPEMAEDVKEGFPC